MKFNFVRLLSIASMMFLFATTALAQTDAAADRPLIKITGAFAVAVAALGGALGDGKAIAAACEGTARNPGAGPRIFTMMILGLALIETLVLLTFVTVLLGQ
jgi:F-type H+-transporting ATPase subunit c